MTNPLGLNDYKQQIAELYNNRSSTYDESDWHLLIARRLVEYAQIIPRQQVLDIATGTGMAAIEAAQSVGEQGQVIGVDISPGMLEVARSKVKALGLFNIEFQLADAEALTFPDNSFDRILCSSAFIWMSDLTAALRHWYRLLKPGGLISFHAFAETSFLGSLVAQKVAEKFGVSLAFNKLTGSAEKCQDLLAAAGYEAIEIKIEQSGNYISLEQAKQMWSMIVSYPAPGQFPHPLSQLDWEQLEQAKAEFEVQLEAMETKQGIWNDVTIFFSLARKPV